MKTFLLKYLFIILFFRVDNSFVKESYFMVPLGNHVNEIFPSDKKTMNT